MNTQRKGSDLKTHIRLALNSLGRDAYLPLDHLKTSALEEMLAGLRREQIAQNIIKPNYKDFE
jgi:hypothetical protein